MKDRTEKKEERDKRGEVDGRISGKKREGVGKGREDRSYKRGKRRTKRGKGEGGVRKRGRVEGEG